jgi:hypothetical protein
MKYPRYSAFVSALLVSPLFLAVGCSGSAGDECSVESAKICSDAIEEILICENGVWTPDTPCAEGTICENSAQGPQCVSEGGTGGSGGSGGTAGSGGTGGTGGGVDECTFDTLDKQICKEKDIYICTSTEGWQLFQDCQADSPSSDCIESPSGVVSCSTL